MRSTLYKKCLAELTGTFAIVFCGTGAIIINGQYGGEITHVGIAATFGLIVMSMIYGLGNISGAHFNPAVSIAFTIAGRFPLKQLPGYMISQLAGACMASMVLRAMFPTSALLGATLPSGTELQSFVMEAILTFLLMLVIMNVAEGSREKGITAGLAIGAVVGLEAMFAGPVSGASMNPARSFGPAIISGHTEHLWLYLLAPIAGAVIAIPVWGCMVTTTKTASK